MIQVIPDLVQADYIFVVAEEKRILQLKADQILRSLSLELRMMGCFNGPFSANSTQCGSICRKELDSPWSWLVCFCATFLIVLLFGISLNFGVLFPVLMDYFQESRERTGGLIDFQVLWSFLWEDDSVGLVTLIYYNHIL